ncbi:MAG: hypothetical protein AAGG07_09485 [Planctomycetota bacterium]
MDNAGTVTAPLSRNWLVRMGIIIVAFAGFGLWGLYDATVAYPARGERAANWLELSYLQQSQDAGRLGAAGIADPVSSLAQVTERIDEGNVSESDRAVLTSRKAWLEQLRVVGKLTAASTDFPRNEAATPRERLEALTQELANREQPKPLSAYDILVQWVIFGVCIGIAGLMVLHVLRIAGQRYRWDASAQRLSLPGGVSLVPADLEDVDKRKWQKFIVFLRVRADHDKAGGQELKLDLLRHAMLEDWILEMERTQFPDRVEDEPEAAPQKAAAPETSADATTETA